MSLPTTERGLETDMRTIYKRELREYFTTPIAYVFIVALSIVSAVFFFIMLLNGTAAMESEFMLLFTATLLLSPILTMRLLCEERKQNTIQLLMSAPVRIADIVLGKFFAAFTVYVLGLVPVLFQAISLAGKAPLNWSIIICNLLGLALVGMACIAICMTVSAVSDNQIVSALGGFAAMILVLLVNTLAGSVNNAFLRSIIYRFSFYNSYYGVTVGVLRLSDLWFFATVTMLFLFFTAQLLHAQRMRGK